MLVGVEGAGHHFVASIVERAKGDSVFLKVAAAS
jgi:hypothetical protein